MVKLSYQINVDLDVLKALTARLEQDGQTHNDVLRDILHLDSPFEAEPREGAFSTVADAVGRMGFPDQFYSRVLRSLTAQNFGRDTKERNTAPGSGMGSGSRKTANSTKVHLLPQVTSRPQSLMVCASGKASGRVTVAGGA